MPLPPRVVAFVRDWSAAREQDAAIRAQLRGLGAELVVVSSDGVWSFGPDDRAMRRDGELAGVARFHVDDGCDALFVLDEDDAIRFAHRSSGVLETSLAVALEHASVAARTRGEPVTFSRREWLTGCLVAGCSLALLSCKARERAAPAAAAAAAMHEVDIELTINDAHHALSVEPRVSLLDAMRERIGLTGTKKGCDAGQCGACTVLIGGRRVLSCLTLAVMAQRKPITTIEGLARGDALHPVQAAFVEHDALQCGFCTPGQIMSAVGMLGERRGTTDDDIREQMSGNICRCGAYPNIVAAIRAARHGGS